MHAGDGFIEGPKPVFNVGTDDAEPDGPADRLGRVVAARAGASYPMTVPAGLSRCPRFDDDVGGSSAFGRPEWWVMVWPFELVWERNTSFKFRIKAADGTVAAVSVTFPG
ncbi:hypothetical protein [Arthrobacter sp. UYCo732]|uniref:hypothetical protein n=1 Tax=Arthrobacter sp. UYCo732 TaxID=3156336 RepID=UPI003395123D